MDKELENKLTPVIPYQKEYEEFVKNYENSIPIVAEEIGKLIARLAQYFGQANSLYGIAKIEYNKTASSYIQTIEDSGKPISAAKAEVLTNASKEAEELIKRNVDIQNLEQMMNALKALQRSTSQEQNHMGNIY